MSSVVSTGDRSVVESHRHETSVLQPTLMEVQPRAANTQKPYSVFTVPQKRAIVLSGSFIGLMSYMSGSIYYPAINQVRIAIRLQSCS